MKATESHIYHINAWWDTARVVIRIFLSSVCGILWSEWKSLTNARLTKQRIEFSANLGLLKIFDGKNEKL